MAASVLAHLLLQDALAAAFAAEALPVAVDAKLFTALRIGTGPEHRLGRGLATGHGARPLLGQSPMISAFDRPGTAKILADLSP